MMWQPEGHRERVGNPTKPQAEEAYVLVSYPIDIAQRKPGENREAFRARMRTEKRKCNGHPRSW